MVRLVLASGNAGKLAELRTLVDNAWSGDIVGLKDLGLEGAEETGGSFDANARLKAEAACAATGDWVLADDSGLCVDELGGLPGVDTAYYGGYDKLLAALRDVPPDRRQAHFVCVLALARPGKETLFFHAECPGHIAANARGEGGFGYDPVFVPDGENRTFAEMDQAEKAALSHRGKALRAFADWLKANA
ncbi:MAG: RdgB/HAM1 family non-canonical purine NTP pyrophosphatase [Pseudomonadaceae bacterium]|nr:RdgB/HAM1 family non-canonical purine NTP pyrophosphatase [Pseudomonadaceae bacterium]